MTIRGERLQRLIVRLACLAVISTLLWPLQVWKSAPQVIVRISPFAAICSGIARRELGAGAALGLLIALIAVFRRRWFCRWVCPAGLLLEGCAHIGLRNTSWWTRWLPLGRTAALLTLAGAVAGYPVLLWMDPLSIFSSAFSVRAAASAGAGFMAGLILGILILLALAAGGLWCARLCPLGGTQELLASAPLLWRKPDDPGQPSPAPAVSAGYLARRAFILGAAGIGLGLLGRKLGAARGEEAPLRPPGAVEEERFTGLCSRCGNCIRACPSKIIHPDAGRAGIAGLLAPAVRYGADYCREDCRACTDVCPSGAIQHLTLEQKRRYVIGEALVDGSLCLVTLARKDCDACARSCPYGAVEIHWDEQQYVAYPLVSPEKCNGCGACEAACPTEDVKAIRVWRIDD